MKADLPIPASDVGPSTAEVGPSSSVRLSDVAADRSAVIVWVDAGSAQGRRLLDLGFLPGTDIRVIRRAPLGDPIQFALRGCNFCLRKSEADDIRVRVE